MESARTSPITAHKAVVRTPAAGFACDATVTVTANPPSQRPLHRFSRAALVGLLAAIALVACNDEHAPRPRTPAEVRSELSRVMPPGTADRSGWAADIQAAFASLGIEPSTPNLCAVVAVAGQESGFHADPAVPGLGRIALAEIDRRAGAHHVPALVVHAALQIRGPDGRSWSDRIAAARTEKDLSHVFEAMIAEVPMGQRLLADANPVRTAGPMQVSIAFAEHLARRKTYPYQLEGSIRHEVFSRRGGVYFGTAHLLGYRTSYRVPLYRFADYNAGWYASRNAAFQKAASVASGIPLAPDGDVIRYDGGDVSRTELAVRTLGPQMGLTNAQVHRSLTKAGSFDFESTDVYGQVFAIAEGMQRHALPRAVLPDIRLASPKITRRLTTAWFAGRVDARYQQCLGRAGAGRR